METIKKFKSRFEPIDLNFKINYYWPQKRCSIDKKQKRIYFYISNTRQNHRILFRISDILLSDNWNLKKTKLGQVSNLNFELWRNEWIYTHLSLILWSMTLDNFQELFRNHFYSHSGSHSGFESSYLFFFKIC